MVLSFIVKSVYTLFKADFELAFLTWSNNIVHLES